MPRQGFLGTGAPLSADITLAIEIAMGLTLVIGMVLARRQRYRAHAWCQSAVVVLNLIVIALVMAPSFRSQVAPKIPGRLTRPYYAVATGHAVVGSVAEMLGLYIVLAVGTKILPEGLRLIRYKLWMRTVLVIWWLALLLGATTYFRWYVAPKPIAPPSPSSSQVPSARGNESVQSCGVTISPMNDGACLVRSASDPSFSSTQLTEPSRVRLPGCFATETSRKVFVYCRVLHKRGATSSELLIEDLKL